jgi:hypothetical protein
LMAKIRELKGRHEELLASISDILPREWKCTSYGGIEVVCSQKIVPYESGDGGIEVLQKSRVFSVAT